MCKYWFSLLKNTHIESKMPTQLLLFVYLTTFSSCALCNNYPTIFLQFRKTLVADQIVSDDFQLKLLRSQINNQLNSLFSRYSINYLITFSSGTLNNIHRFYTEKLFGGEGGNTTIYLYSSKLTHYIFSVNYGTIIPDL